MQDVIVSSPSNPCGAARKTIRTKTTGLHLIASAADGRTLALVSDGACHVLLWDAETGLPGGELKGHALAVYAIDFAPNPTDESPAGILASGSGDGHIRLWDVATRKCLQIQEVPQRPKVYTVVFAPKSRMLASGGADGTITLWDVIGTTLRRRHTFCIEHTKSVCTIAFSCDGEKLASGGDDKVILVWDVATGHREGPEKRGHCDEVQAVAWSPDGRTLASGSADKTIMLWDVDGGEPRMRLRSEEDESKPRGISLLSFATILDRRTFLASVWQGNAIALWEVSSLWEASSLETPSCLFEGSRSVMTSFAFVPPGGQTFATCCRDGTIELWDISSAVSLRAAAGDGRSASAHPPPPLFRAVDTETDLDLVSEEFTSLRDELSIHKKSTEAAAVENEALRRENEALRRRIAELEEALNKAPFPAGAPYRLSGAPTTCRDQLLVPASSPVFDLCQTFVKSRGSLSRGARERFGAVAGCRVADIELLGVDVTGFEARLRVLAGRHGSPDTVATRTKEQLQVLLLLNKCFEAKRVLAADPNQPDLLFAFHGTRIDVLPKVITGLVAKRTTDPGYFGAGVYVTPNLEYAAQYAVGKFDSPSATGGPRSSREDGSYPVVLVCAAIGEAHPITRSGDYRKGPEHGSLLQAANTNSDWYGKPLKPGCDAHVVGVSERTNFQAEDDLAHMTYLEIVIDQEAQVLPLAIIWVQPTPP